MGYGIFRNELETLKKYVPGKPIEEVKREYGLTDIVKLASNENPLGPSPMAIEAIREEAVNVHIYPESMAPKLRNALAEELNIDAEGILLGNGGEEILKFIAQTFVNTGDEAIMGKPSFGLYNISVSHMGGTCVEVPLTDRFEHDLDTFLEKVTDKTKLVYVCNPNNPTGNIMSADKINAFVDKLPEHPVLVLDEAYYDFAIRNPEYPDGLEILKRRKNTIILRTFSKVAGLAAVRVGYCISHPEIIAEMTKVKGVFNCNRLAQVAGVAALKDKDHLKNTVDLNYQSLDLMIDCFNRNNLDFIPSNANFIWAKSPISSKDLYEFMLREGVIMRPGFLWGQDEWFRVSTGTVEQTERFVKVLEKILKDHA